MENAGIKSDLILTAIIDALSTDEKRICNLKETTGIPQTWESYDLRKPEELKAIQSSMRNGYKYYTLALEQSLNTIQRSVIPGEPETGPARRMVRYDSTLKHLRQTMPRHPKLRRRCAGAAEDQNTGRIHIQG